MTGVNGRDKGGPWPWGDQGKGTTQNQVRGLYYYLAQKKRDTLSTNVFFFQILMKISTMMVHQYLVWPSLSAITADILLNMEDNRFSGVYPPYF